MYSLEFTQDDLSANQQGDLSEVQKKRIANDVDMLRQQGRRIVWIFVIFFAALAIAIAIYLYFNEGRDIYQLLSPELRIFFAGLAGIMILLFILVVFLQMWSARRLARASVSSITGKAHLITEIPTRQGMLRVHNVQIRPKFFFKKTFRFQSDQSLRHFQEGVRYRVYYLRYSIPLVLSIEEAPEKKRKWFWQREPKQAPEPTPTIETPQSDAW
jgi:hypothetical protein